MRWTQKEQNAKPCVADTRVCKGFLFLPKKIDGETRWLEFAKWQEYYSRWGDGEWIPKKWLRLNE